MDRIVDFLLTSQTAIATEDHERVIVLKHLVGIHPALQRHAEVQRVSISIGYSVLVLAVHLHECLETLWLRRAVVVEAELLDLIRRRSLEDRMF